MDYLGTLDGEPFAGGEGRDQMIELGSGRLIPGFEEQLIGAGAGEERTVRLTFPVDYGAEHLAGQEAEFAVSVKEVKERNLPELDDDFAIEHGFDTLDELRDDIRGRLSEGLKSRADTEFREAVLDAAVEKATVTVPEPLIEARAAELWDQMAHTLSHQGIDKATYLKIAGKTEEEIVDEAKPDAERQLRREAVLAAVVEAEGSDPTDDDLREALAADAERSRSTPKKLLDRIRSLGRVDSLKEDVAHASALDVLVDSATPIAKERAEAREKIWTPGSR